MVCHYFSLQDIKISFEDVDFYAKLSLILDTLLKKLNNPMDHSIYCVRRSGGVRHWVQMTGSTDVDED